MASLQVRVPLLGSAVLAVGLAVAASLAFVLILFTGKENLEVALIREQRRVERSLPLLVEDVGGQEGSPPTAETLGLAAERYFRINPGTDTYFTMVRVGEELFAADDGPDVIERLHASDQIPRNPSLGLETLDTPEGEILSLLTVLPIGGGPPGTIQIVAPTEPARAEAFRALAWLGVASGVSLGVAGILLTLILRRALAPLHALASIAGQAELEDLSVRVPEPRGLDEVGVLSREFNGMLERLEDAAASQREFMAAVSHELRTPVTIARGHIEVLESSALEDPQSRAETASLVRGELIRMQRLVDDLMAVARSRAEGFVVKRPVGLPAFFVDLELRLTGLGTRPVGFDPAPELFFEADGERLAQAVLNLIINADVHTPEGCRIQVGARDEGDTVAIFVQDEGPGIDPTIRDTMFEPFVKVGAGVGSSGLGLAVVAAVVEAHHGDIEVATGPGGTTFTLRVPIGPRRDHPSASGGRRGRR